MTQMWDVIVIGGGPAGLSAALMLGRARRRVLVIDSGQPRNRFAAQMHGVLGNEGASPAALTARGREEAEGYGVELRAGAVERVDEIESGVLVTVGGVAQALRARAVIVASGMSDVLPDIPGLAERWGTTVLHCPYCHGWEVRDRRLGVLVASPPGVHQAELIRQWSDHVVAFTAGAGPLGDAAEARLRSRGVGVVTEAVVELVGDGDELTGVRTSDGRLHEIDALFTAGRPSPHDAFLEHLGLVASETPWGSFLSVDTTGKTSSDRIWAVGNVVNPGANVPMSVGAGALAGGALNAALVAEDFDSALAALDREAERS